MQSFKNETFLKLNFEIELLFSKKKRKQKNVFFSDEAPLPNFPPLACIARVGPPPSTTLRHCTWCYFYFCLINLCFFMLNCEINKELVINHALKI